MHRHIHANFRFSIANGCKYDIFVDSDIFLTHEYMNMEFLEFLMSHTYMHAHTQTHTHTHANFSYLITNGFPGILNDVTHKQTHTC